VEDEVKVARFIERGLKEEYYAVDVALDGVEGLHLAETNNYDLIVLDVLLPKKDGWQFLMELRAAKKNTLVLMLTARDTVPDRVRGLNLGADDYLTKPFAFEEFLARVQALLRRKESSQLRPLQVADLIMDMQTHQVRRGGRLIELTAKEYALLEYLLRYAGKIVTRTQIAEHVWDYHFDSTTNVIDVYIHYLRDKIDRGFPTRLIHTVRGVGYVVKEESP
jgi:heavy metal response regulator